MKKILLGTTAVIALGTLSTEAFAADKIKLELGGFMRQYVGVSNSDEVATTANTNVARDTGIGQQGNTEVYFKGSTTLDNGLTVAAHIELEANNTGAANNASNDNIDRSYMTISSNEMGSLTLGAAPHAGGSLVYYSPNAVGNCGWRDCDGWTGGAAAAATATTAVAVVGQDLDSWGNDSVKIKYMSPSFSGFQVGGSWAGTNSDGESEQLQTSADDDTYSFGAKYATDMDGIAIGVGVAHGHTTDDVSQTRGSASISTAGFTVSGGYTDYDDEITSTGAMSSNDGNGWDVGVGYKTGPYSLSAQYANVERDGLSTAGNDELTDWKISASYDMGAGVALQAVYMDTTSDEEGTTAAVDTNAFIAGIEIGF